MEADVARARQQQHATSESNDSAAKTGGPAKESEDSNAAKGTAPAKDTEEAGVQPPGNSDQHVISPTDRTSRRRKVKFDITTTEVVAGEKASLKVNGESQENQGEGVLRPCLLSSDNTRRADI